MMRVMVLIKATTDSEAGVMPSMELIQAMGAYNQQLVEAGIMLDGDGLKPSAQGKRVAFDGDIRDMDEAVEWLKRCPNPMPGPSEVEIRPLYEPADFAEAMTPEMAAQEQQLRDQLADT